ncbi:MAG TPA: molybdopterin molybdotransferase MoeA [Candidatus Nanopelagicales bacterium]
MGLVEPRWDVARAALADAVGPLPASHVALEDSDGLVLAEPLVARAPLPGFDTSAMDGWAVAGPGPWTVVGASLAGRPAGVTLGGAQAVVIATGAVVPTGADAVIRSEDGTVRPGADGRDVLAAPDPAAGSHVRPAGEECRAGDALAPAGTLVTPALVGLAAAAGLDELLAVPRPRVALALFGDELATSGVAGPGLVRDSLGPQVPGWLRRMGAVVVGVRRCEDTLDAHVTAIADAAREADLVLTTGGTAAGPVDHLHTAIAAVGGQVLVDSVAVRPGHPMIAARLPGGRRREVGAAAPQVWLVGLPGNPQSAIVTLMSLAAPLLAGLAGRPPLPDLAVVTAAVPVAAPATEDRLVLGTIDAGVFTPGSHLGSGMLRGLAAATGFAVLPPGGVPAGAPVRWLPLP